MANIREVRSKIQGAHNALAKGASLLKIVNQEHNHLTELEYMERELHKILGRLEALDAGLDHHDVKPVRMRVKTPHEGEPGAKA